MHLHLIADCRAVGCAAEVIEAGVDLQNSLADISRTAQRRRRAHLQMMADFWVDSRAMEMMQASEHLQISICRCQEGGARGTKCTFPYVVVDD